MEPEDLDDSQRERPAQDERSENHHDLGERIGRMKDLLDILEDQPSRLDRCHDGLEIIVE